jgi:hypothetical protein
MQNNNEKPLTIHGENFTMEEAFNNVVESYEKLKEMHEELTVDEELSQINEKIELGKMRIHELEGGLEHLRFIRDVLISRKDIVRADIINAQRKEVLKWLDEQYQIVQMYSHCVSCVYLSRANKI